MRLIRIALCSPAMTRSEFNGMTMGLDFLSRIIRKKYGRDVEFYTIHERDVMKLGRGDVDYLFVSFIGSSSALAYAKAVKYKKPPVFTAIGGPAMLFPAVFRETADAIMVGRGEDCILRLLEGDYTGMMRPDSTLANDSVHIFKTSLISPGQQSVGCLFRCGFCSYSWMHTFATTSAWMGGGEYTSNKISGKKDAPSAEFMLKDLHFWHMHRSPYRLPIMGLDMLTAADTKLIKKPCSFALLKSVIRRLSKESKGAQPGTYRARLFTVTAFPWNDPVLDFTLLSQAMYEGDFDEGVIVRFVMSLNHFIPQITTPFECCAVNLNSIREYVKTYREPRWPSRGACFQLEKMGAPSPMQAVQQAIMQRASDPGVLPVINKLTDYRDLASAFPGEVGWQSSKPAPWIRRNNDVSKRVKQFYDGLPKVSKINLPMPSGYAPFTAEPDRYGVPVADF